MRFALKGDVGDVVVLWLMQWTLFEKSWLKAWLGHSVVFLGNMLSAQLQLYLA